MLKQLCALILMCVVSVMAAADDTKAVDTGIEKGVSVEFCGRLRHGVVAIGGESTGTNISAGRIIWEVQLNNDADREFAATNHKQTVVVSGRLRKVRGVEMKDRWIIDVKKLSVPDALKDQPAVKLTIAGLLRAAEPASVAWMAIEATEQVWPIDRPSDAAVTIAAETMVGQSVLLTGSLKTDAEYVPGSMPLIQVTSVKRSQQTSGVGSRN